MEVNRRRFLEMTGWGALGVGMFGLGELVFGKEERELQERIIRNRTSYDHWETEIQKLLPVVEERNKRLEEKDPNLIEILPMTQEQGRIEVGRLKQARLDEYIVKLEFAEKIVSAVKFGSEIGGSVAFREAFGNDGVLTERDWAGSELDNE